MKLGHLRLNVFFLLLVMPYLALRRLFRLVFGNLKNYRIFHQARLDSTVDYLEKLGVPALVRPWIDVRTRFAFERPVVEAASRVRGGIFMDIGANMGYYTALLSKNFETIMAFEPHPANSQLLRYTVRAGKLHNVIISDLAVSDFDGMTKLYIRGKRVEHSTEVGEPESKSLAIQTVKLDSIVRSPADLVKVDVEGAEWRVLRGAEASIRAGRILRWIIEVDDQNNRQKLEDYLKQKNYKTRWLDPRHLFAKLAGLQSE